VAEQKEERLRFQARSVSVRCGRAHRLRGVRHKSGGADTPPPDGLAVERDGGG
jgi:hypothetical protein